MCTETVSVDAAEFGAATGQGVRVLLADSGVETAHPALQGVAVSCWCVQWSGSVDPLVVVPDDGDVYGHGTAVASLLHQHAPEAEIASVRVLGPGLRGASAIVLAGLRWGVGQGYDIITCSFGAPHPDFRESYRRLVAEAACRNTWLITAWSHEDLRAGAFAAHFPDVLSTDFARLSGLTLRRRRASEVEFVASGDRLVVPWRGGGYRTVSGCSFAAAHLAAMAARLRQLRPTWSASQVKAALSALAEEDDGQP